MYSIRLACALLLAGTALTACGGNDSTTSDGTTTLRVFAAASLTASFETIAKDFEADHAGVTVELNFGGSSDLVTQIDEGAPADVFASADEANMTTLVDAGSAAGDPVNFATNTMEIAVPAGNPAGIKTLADLTKADVKLVTCAPEVPCGAAATTIAEDAGLKFTPVSEEDSVTGVLSKVSSGEADAGLVYVTDIAAADNSVEGITFPESKSVVNTYPIVTIEGSDNSDLADEFTAMVTGEAGQQVLAEAGFGKP